MTEISSETIDSLARILKRAERLLERAETLFPPLPAEPAWDLALAFRWRRFGTRGFLQAVDQPHEVRLADLLGIDRQKERIVQNTRQFIAGRPANNVLLTGSRGSGKSSLIKALLREYADRGLRLIEVDKDELTDLPEIVALICRRRERFILFCDDLSFEAGESTYKALKVVLDGSIAAAPENVLIYATSSRRHLMPEYFAENLQAQHRDGEIHPSEAVEEKIALSERFGLWLSFYPFDQDEYLAIVAHWLRTFAVSETEILRVRQDALNWALMRGSRNGRVAWQFAKNYAGSINPA